MLTILNNVNSPGVQVLTSDQIVDGGAVLLPGADPGMIRADWENAISVETSFATLVSTGRTGLENRRLLSDRPYRKIRSDHKALAGGELESMYAQYMSEQLAGDITHWPLWTDYVKLTADLEDGDSSISISDPSLHRFAVGVPVLIAEHDRRTPGFMRFSKNIITSTSSSAFGLQDEHAGGTIGAGARVYPLMRVVPAIDVQHTPYHSQATRLSHEALETHSKATIPAITIPGLLPPASPVWKGYPIWDFPIDWAAPRVGATRPSNQTVVGLEAVTEFFGDDPRASATVSCRFLTRASWWRFQSFFESRGGRAFPFWFPLPVNIGASATWIEGGLILQYNGDDKSTFEAYFYNRLANKTIAIILSDGSTHVRRMPPRWAQKQIAVDFSTGEVTGYTYSFFLDGDRPAETGTLQVRRVCPAVLARFNQDFSVSNFRTMEIIETGSMDLVALCETDYDECEAVVPDFEDPDNNGDPPDPWEPETEICSQIDESGVAGSPPLVPMFFNPAEFSPGTNRVPVRGADWQAPKQVAIEIPASYWAVDDNHPSGSVSENAIEAMGGQHILSYVGSVSGQASGHYHHMHNTGSAWALGSSGTVADTIRHIYRKTIDYSDGSELREMVIEHVISWLPSADWATAGGPNIGTKQGAWGAICDTLVFTDELDPDWVDDVSTFTPATASVGAVTMNRNNPCVSALHFGGDERYKVFHPQLLACMHVPMSFHDPLGYAVGFKPVEHERQEYSYRRSSNWPCHNDGFYATSGTKSAIGNVVYDRAVSGAGGRAVMLGGNAPESDPYRALIAENARGNGGTMLKPLSAGLNSDGTLSLNVPGVWVKCDNEDQSAARICRYAGHPDSFANLRVSGSTYAGWTQARPKDATGKYYGDSGFAGDTRETTLAIGLGPNAQGTIRCKTVWNELKITGVGTGNQTSDITSSTHTASHVAELNDQSIPFGTDLNYIQFLANVPLLGVFQPPSSGQLTDDEGWTFAQSRGFAVESGGGLSVLFGTTGGLSGAANGFMAHVKLTDYAQVGNGLIGMSIDPVTYPGVYRLGRTNLTGFNENNGYFVEYNTSTQTVALKRHVSGSAAEVLAFQTGVPPAAVVGMCTFRISGDSIQGVMGTITLLKSVPGVSSAVLDGSDGLRYFIGVDFAAGQPFLGSIYFENYEKLTEQWRATYHGTGNTGTAELRSDRGFSISIALPNPVGDGDQPTSIPGRTKWTSTDGDLEPGTAEPYVYPYFNHKPFGQLEVDPLVYGSTEGVCVRNGGADLIGWPNCPWCPNPANLGGGSPFAKFCYDDCSAPTQAQRLCCLGNGCAEYICDLPIVEAGELVVGGGAWGENTDLLALRGIEQRYGEDNYGSGFTNWMESVAKPAGCCGLPCYDFTA